METIKNYLETMFRNLPDTDQVRKAKKELLQMMEDKFSELRNNGVSENEAVGTVISEFGNLEELAEDLGLENIIHNNKDNMNRRSISFDEVKNYVAERKSCIITVAIAIFCFITCVTPVIITDEIFNNNAVGLALMFAFIAAGVVLNVIAGSRMADWDYIKNEPCSISQESIDYIANEKKNFKTKYSVFHAAGILLCMLCFVPAAIMDEMKLHFSDPISGVSLFICIGLGVGFLIYSNKVSNMHEMLLNINSTSTIGGSYSQKAKQNNGEVKYNNKVVKVIMDVYWSTITCIYLIWSFLTFNWEHTWIIWPIAAVVQTMIKGIYGIEGDE